MIASLTGNPIGYYDKYCILDVHGVGYKVYTTEHTLSTLQTLSGPATLRIHTIVREDTLDLFGFLDDTSHKLFEKLITVSGVGPKSALGVLGVAPAEKLVEAISSGDISYLTKVSGIGKKTAEKILLELKDKLLSFGEVSLGGVSEESEVLLALESLGYTSAEAREALQYVDKSTGGTNNKVREALKALHK
jgi:holliday junction DNA helicase RuvA